MKMPRNQLLHLSVILFISFNGVRGKKDYFTAAVFENVQFADFSFSGREIIEKNLEQYAIAAKKASSQMVDIILYSEKGLYPKLGQSLTWAFPFAENVPDPTRKSANPCDQHDIYVNRPVLRNLSCLAKELNMYVVADIIDVKECQVEDSCNEYNVNYCRQNKDDCPKDGKFHFNTLVIFDRNGTLVVRYYKRDLFAIELAFNTPKISPNFYLETEFGIFTGAICFDLLFKKAAESTRMPNVTTLLYPSRWYDTSPTMYFATPFQMTWAISSRVNVLGSNVHYPPEGTLGSGIFSPVLGPMVYTDNPDGRSKLLISNLPISPMHIQKDMPLETKFYYIDDGYVTELQGEEPRSFGSECQFNVLGKAKSFTDYRCKPLPLEQFTFIKLNETRGNIKAVSNGFHCRMNYEAQSMDETFYFGVTEKKQKFANAFIHIQTCFLARCEPLNGKPCRNFLLKSNTIFNSVEIEGSFDAPQVNPFAIDSDIRLTDKNEWTFNGKSKIKYQNMKRKPLLFFGLNGRLYDRDDRV